MRYIVALLVILLVGLSAHAQEPFIYPAKGQSAQQQQKDQYECYAWAKGNTGFDPMSVPRASTPAPRGSGGSANVAGSTVRGAAGGAAIGAAAGAIAGGKAGKGAAIGAVSGGMLRGMGAMGQNQQASNDRKDWERREAGNYAAKRDSYDRAFSACMEGRGYTVK